MAVSLIAGPNLIDATDDVSDGVQSVSFTWRFKTTVSPTLTDNLPHVVKTLFGLNLATVGTPAPGLPLCTCRKTSLKRDGTNGVYLFKADYSDKGVDTSVASPAVAVGTNPLNDPVLPIPTASIKPRAVYVDRAGNALMNSALDPMIQSKDNNTISYTIKANVAVDTLDTALEPFLDTCNDAAILIAGRTVSKNAARFLLQPNFMSEPKTRNNVSYKELTFEIWIDERDLHYGVPMDAGFRQRIEVLDDSGATPVSYVPQRWRKEKILDDDGSEITDPAPLDAGLKMDDPQPETVVYLQQKLYPEADYTTLPGISASV